jgi:hypothetical protein
LLDGGSQNLWALDYVAAEYERGTLEAFTNLSVQSPGIRQPDDAAAAAFQPGVSEPDRQRLHQHVQRLEGISDTRAPISNVIADAIGRGVNRETASIISKRLDVSMSKAKTIAQTEQVGALRQAQWNETDWAADRLG